MVIYNYIVEWKLLYYQICPLTLHAAIMNKHPGIVKELLDKGFPVNTTDTHEWTPLHCACYCGDTEILVTDY